jgi:hypothetical protein
MNLPISLIPPIYPSEMQTQDAKPASTDVENAVESVNDDNSLVVTVDDDKSLMEYTIKELRDMCRERDLSTAGKKADLIARLE